MCVLVKYSVVKKHIARLRRLVVRALEVSELEWIKCVLIKFKKLWRKIVWWSVASSYDYTICAWC